jgi:hypothetical protein
MGKLAILLLVGWVVLAVALHSAANAIAGAMDDSANRISAARVN